MTHDLLRLTQWLSPAFPTGAYAYSQGLEWGMGPGGLNTAAKVQDWLETALRRGSAWADAVILSQMLQGADPADMAAWVQATAASSGRLRDSLDQGRAFAATLGLSPAPLPVAVGLAARGLDLPADLILAHYLQAWVTNLATIAVRSVPLGQTEGQAIIAALQPAILEVAARAADASLDDLGTAAFGADLAGMLQETLDVRIYRT